MSRIRARYAEKFIIILTITSLFVVLIYERSSYREKIIPTYYKSENPIDWVNVDLRKIDRQNILMDYFRWTNKQSCQRSHLMGGKTGHSICLDPPAVPREFCLVYSFDFLHDWYFENEIKDFNCHVFNFDPSILETKLENWKGREDFSDIKSPGIKSISLTNSNPQKHKGNMPRTFESIYRVMNRLLDEDEKHKIDYMKLDIEGEEWDIIPLMIEFEIISQIRQLGVEIHLFKDDLDYYREIAEKIQALEKEGMIRFHSKETPCSYSGFQEKWPKDHQIMLPIKCFALAWYQKFP